MLGEGRARGRRVYVGAGEGKSTKLDGHSMCVLRLPR